MSQKIGDLTLDILLNIKEAENGAKQITASLKNVEGVTNKVIQSSSDLTGKMGKLGFALNAVRDAGQILGSSLSTIFNTIRASNDAYQQFLSSNRQLEATSKLTVANLKDLNKISEQTKNRKTLFFHNLLNYYRYSVLIHTFLFITQIYLCP